MSAAIMAFLHHVAAFTAVAALGVEVALFTAPLSLAQARRLQRTDSIFGVAAGVVLVVGLVRVVYFEKGPAYQIAAVVSIYPTVTFIAWNRSLRIGQAPQLTRPQSRHVRLCLRCELALILVILACAALMARGFGSR